MKKILLVDDDEDISEVVEYILIGRGFDVYRHASGSNISAIIKRYKPNLILLDIRLPGGKSGTDICKELKKTYSTPIILFSAEHNISYKKFDADDFLQKPFDIKELLDIININLIKQF